MTLCVELELINILKLCIFFSVFFLFIRLLVVLCYGRGGVVLADEQVSVFSGISTAAVEF